MATYTVTTTGDVVDPADGQLSLREALALADVDPTTADTIDFAPAVQGGRIVLGGSQLTAGSDVTLDGGAGITIDANQASRVLLVQGSGTDAVLHHLTITGGRTTGDYDGGGGVRAESETTLALNHTTVSGNTTAGSGASGGGISGAGEHIAIGLTDSTVSGNSTAGYDADGGGISGAGYDVAIALTNSTVYGNDAGGNHAAGGGISGAGEDSAIALTNSTVTSNSAADYAGGGIDGYDVRLTNSTVAGNSAVSGGGIHQNYSGPSVPDASVIVTVNSIVAGNIATYGGGFGPDVDGVITSSNGRNIFGSEVAGALPSDHQNVPASALFTGGLADHGGPTQTLGLLDDPSNPALGRAELAYAPAMDQRGEIRPQPAGTNPDIGAFELNQANPSPPPIGQTLVVATTSDVSADDGVLTLREALALANSDNSTADRIEFALSVQGHTVMLAGGQLTADSDVTIDGGAGVIIDASQASRVLLVQGFGTDAVLRHLTVTGGTTVGYDIGDAYGGGGIRAENHTTLTLDHATVSGNRTAGSYSDGGGIFGDTVTLIDSTVSGNHSIGSGGGISVTGLATLIGSTVSNNESAYRGGGIYGDATLTNSTVSGNRTTGDYAGGGGIHGIATLTNSTVSDNLTVGAKAYGGGIYGDATLTNSTVAGNSTAGYLANGGGIYGDATLLNSTVSGNRSSGAYASGGGIDGYRVTSANSTIVDNVAAGAGGGMLIHGRAELANSTIVKNSSESYGGGISGFVATEITLANSIVAGNAVTSGSGSADIYGTISSSNGHNILGSNVGGSASGDRENLPSSLLFAGGLADHGGPTQTIALRDAADNPALAGADPAAAPATDQRGEARPQPAGTAPDIGAFELNQTGGTLNEIVGTPHNDFLRGTAGLDMIQGLAGNDRLWGRDGDDQLFGGAGRDVLAGKQGIDQMTGGAGADRFLFRHSPEAPPNGPAYDTILDFSRAQHDKIDLRPIDADRSGQGNQAFHFIGEHDFTRPGQLRYEATADGDFFVTGNTDRDLAADFAIVVHTNLTHLHATDFLL